MGIYADSQLKTDPAVSADEPSTNVTKPKKDRCLVCRKKFPDKDSLNEHMQKVHKIKIGQFHASIMFLLFII